MATPRSDQLQRLVNRMAFVPLGAIMLYGCFAAFQRNDSVEAQFTKVQTTNHKVAPVSRTRVRQTSIGDVEPYDALEEEFLLQLNQYRASNRVAPVRPSVLLSVSAEKLSRELAESGSAALKFHSRNTRARAQAAGYTVNTRFETILRTTRVDPATMLDLMKVNGNDNTILLDPAWKVIGIGRNYCEHDGRWCWVLDFAASFERTPPMADEYLIKLNLTFSGAPHCTNCPRMQP